LRDVLTRGSIPKVDSLPEGDCQDVGGAPVEKVEIVVIHELGGVEDLLGSLGDVASSCLLLVVRDLVLAVEDAHRVDVPGGGRGGVCLEGQDLGGSLVVVAEHVVGERGLVAVLGGGALRRGARCLGVEVLSVEVVARHVAVHGATLGDEAIALRTTREEEDGERR